MGFSKKTKMVLAELSCNTIISSIRSRTLGNLYFTCKKRHALAGPPWQKKNGNKRSHFTMKSSVANVENPGALLGFQKLVTHKVLGQFFIFFISIKFLFQHDIPSET